MRKEVEKPTPEVAELETAATTAATTAKAGLQAGSKSSKPDSHVGAEVGLACSPIVIDIDPTLSTSLSSTIMCIRILCKKSSHMQKHCKHIPYTTFRIRIFFLQVTAMLAKVATPKDAVKRAEELSAQVTNQSG